MTPHLDAWLLLAIAPLAAFEVVLVIILALLAGILLVIRSRLERTTRRLEAKIAEAEEATRAAAEEAGRAQQYLDVAEVILLELDREGRIALINKRGAELLGNTPARLAGMHWIDTFIPPAERETVRGIFRDAMASLPPDRPHPTVVGRLLLPTGEIRHLRWKNHVLRDGSGRATGSLSSGLDITDSVRHEEALRQQGETLAAVAKAAQLFLGPGSWADHIHDVLRDLCRVTGSSRAYLFGITETPAGGHVASQLYEWVQDGIEPQIDNPELANINLEDSGLPRWVEELSAGNAMHGPTAGFPPDERPLLESQDIRSLAIVPVFAGPVWKGMLGFDDCVEERQWSATDLAILRAAASALGSAVHGDELAADLLRSEERYRTITENNRDLVVQFDIHGKLLFANNTVSELLVDAENILRRPALALVHDDDRAEAERAFAQVVKEGAPSEATVRHRTRHGLRWFEWRYFRITGLSPDQDIIQAVGRDVTEAHAIAEELRRQKDFLRQILDAIPNYVTVKSMDGTLVLCNQIVADENNTTMDEIVGKTNEQLGLSDALAERCREENRWIARSGKSIQIDNHSWVPRGSSEQRILQFIKSPLRDIDGDVRNILIVGTDITDLKQAQVRVEQSERRLRLAIESANLGTWDWSVQDGGLVVNEAWAAMLGLRTADLRGHYSDWADRVHPDDYAAVRAVLDPHLRGETESYGCEMRMRCADGSWKWIYTAGQVVERDNRRSPLRAAGIHMDVDARKRVEEATEAARAAAEAAARAKSQFLANMSHEIRTPLNAVIGMAELLLDTGLDENQREYAHVVHRSGEALLDVISNVLDLSKIEAGKLEFESIEFDLRACVEHVGDLLGRPIHDKGLELTLFVDPGTPSHFRGDPTRLRQVLLNLVNNAIKFTEHGEINVEARVEEHHGDGTADIVFEVRDTGIGIPPERQHRLFQPFSQVDASTTRRFGGTGLGLAISRHLVNMMGGTIGVDSREGQGSTFWFRVTLPVIHRDTGTRGTRRSLDGQRILIVDDNATNRRLLSILLERWGAEPVEAASGEDALALLGIGQGDGARPAAGDFMAAVLDGRMPGLDGLETAAAIRAAGTWSALPLVLLTSFPSAVSPSVPEPRFAARLIKPVKPSHLFNTLLAILEERTPPAPDGTTSPAPGERQAPARGRVLLVEDNPVNQQVAKRMLEKLGYSWDVASNGLEAISRVRARDYDAILMDCQMPELDGYGATRRIRHWEQAQGRPPTPIIAMTAEALEGDRERCLRSGMDEYIPKPIQLEVLHKTLHRLTGAGRPANGAKQPPPAATEPPRGDGIDRKRLDEVSGGDREFARELLDLFLADAARRIRTCRERQRAGAFERLEREAHALKGAGANVGATRIANLGLELEHRSRDRNAGACREIIGMLEEELESVRGHVGQIVGA